jgi:hypothetical protein
MVDYVSEPSYSLPTYPNAITGTLGQGDDQYLRRWTLTLTSSGAPLASAGGSANLGSAFGTAPATTAGPPSGDAVVITTETPGFDFRMTFQVRHADIGTPGTAEIRVYNLSNTTAAAVIQEFDQVILEAGYQTGHFGIIFRGTIKQFKRGRENATDSYLDIFAADGDLAINHSTIAKTLPPQNTADDRTRALVDAMKHQAGLGEGEIAKFPGGVLPRGAVLYGSNADEMYEHARTAGATWSVQDGQLQLLASTAYKRGDIVVINSGTGMVGVPEVTQDGIYVTTLLNPNVYVKGRVQLDNRTLNQTFLPGGANPQGQIFEAPGASGQFGFAQLQPFLASTAQDGVYCILVIDHAGDTRGLPWYTRLNCLNINPDQPFDAALSAGGWSPS